MAELTQATVTITADEYFDMRSKAQTNLYLTTRLTELENRLYEVSARLYELERKVNDNG